MILGRDADDGVPASNEITGGDKAEDRDACNARDTAGTSIGKKSTGKSEKQ